MCSQKLPSPVPHGSCMWRSIVSAPIAASNWNRRMPWSTPVFIFIFWTFLHSLLSFSVYHDLPSHFFCPSLSLVYSIHLTSPFPSWVSGPRLYPSASITAMIYTALECVFHFPGLTLFVCITNCSLILRLNWNGRLSAVGLESIVFNCLVTVDSDGTVFDCVSASIITATGFDGNIGCKPFACEFPLLA